MPDKYICSSCGREFDRKFSAQRHLLSVERSVGSIIPKGAYLAGIATFALVPPKARPVYTNKIRASTKLIAETLMAKFCELMAYEAWSDPMAHPLVMTTIHNYRNLELRPEDRELREAFEVSINNLIDILSRKKQNQLRI